MFDRREAEKHEICEQSIRTARKCLRSSPFQPHAYQATTKARERVEQMRRRGDAEGADTWSSPDATIRPFSPEIDPDKIRPKALPARNQAFRGEIMRIALKSLRKAQKPLGTQEIALQVMAGRGLNTADKGLLLGSKLA